MIRMVTGLMGGGKTYFMTRKQVEELQFTERFVGTNCRELVLPRLNEYLQQQLKADIEAGRREPVDLHSRMVMIPREGVFEFFRYRSGGLVLPKPPGRDTIKPWSRKAFDFAMNNFYRDRETWEECRPGDPPSGIGYFEKVADPKHPEWSKPVTYFLTEFHDFFNAQDWQEVGPAAQYYISKHRHLHDELVFETQMPEQVDAACRRLVEQTFVIENHYSRSFGPFKRRGCFKAMVYFKTQTKFPYDVFEFKLDPKGIGSCYKTTGALGLMERGSETASKGFGLARAKLPWWSMWVGGAAAVVVVFLILWMIPKFLGRMLGSALASTTHGMASGMRDTSQSSTSMDTRPDSVRVSASGERGGQPVERITITGFAASRLRGRLSVFLSDGRVMDERSGASIRMDRAGAWIDGVRYYFARPQPAPVFPSVVTSFGVAGSPVIQAPSVADPVPVAAASSVQTGAWRLDPDGVYRLVESGGVGTSSYRN